MCMGQTLKPDEYIGMTRREVLDGYLRQRAINNGATAINGLVSAPFSQQLCGGWGCVCAD